MLAFHFLYSLNAELNVPMNDDDILEQIDLLIEGAEIKDSEMPQLVLTPHARNFAFQLIKGALTNRETLLSLIEKKLERSLKHIDKITSSILLLASYELTHKLTPANVVINEAINLTKTYGDKGGHTIVNAVLDKMAKELE